MEESTTNKILETLPQGKVEKPIIFKLFWAFILLSFFITVMNLLLIIFTFKDLFGNISLDQIVGQLWDNFIFLAIFVLIPSLLLSFLISSNIGKPIVEISKNIKEIANGNLNIEIKTDRKDELGNLIKLFNELVFRMKQTKERNAEISKMKSTFITVASHQLRTPASGVRWGLDALLSEGKGPLNAEQKTIVEQCISKNSETIKSLDDFLNVTQIEEDAMPYEFKEIEIATLLQKIVDTFAVEIKLKERTIVIENKLDKNFKIIGDPERLSIVFNNIIENAVKYGTSKTAIEVTIEKEDEHLLVQISNYGLEILKNDQNKLFTRFFRAPNAIKLKPDGIGLGLFICKNIVEHHKGNITAMSENGKTTFSVYLPIRAELIAEKSKAEEFLENI